jgi:hypothetical protein
MSSIKKIEQRPQEVTTGYECDVCGKKINGFPSNWFHFNQHHDGWGNDSIDSYQYFDVCSPGCFLTQLKESVDKLKDERTGEVPDMPIEFAEALIKFMER